MNVPASEMSRIDPRALEQIHTAEVANTSRPKPETRINGPMNPALAIAATAVSVKPKPSSVRQDMSRFSHQNGRDE